MLAYYAPDKSEQGIANQLGLKSSWQSKDYMVAMRKYSGVKVMQIIGEIRYCDAKSKGVGNPSLGDGDLLRELVYKILLFILLRKGKILPYSCTNGHSL